MQLAHLAFFCTLLIMFLGQQLSDKGEEWLKLLPLAGMVLGLLCSLMKPLSADSDLSSHIKSFGLSCLLSPIVIIFPMFLLFFWLDSISQNGYGIQIVQAMALGVVLLALASYYVKKSYLTGLFDQYGQIE